MHAISIEDADDANVVDSRDLYRLTNAKVIVIQVDDDDDVVYVIVGYTKKHQLIGGIRGMDYSKVDDDVKYAAINEAKRAYISGAHYFRKDTDGKDR